MNKAPFWLAECLGTILIFFKCIDFFISTWLIDLNILANNFLLPFAFNGWFLVCSQCPQSFVTVLLEKQQTTVEKSLIN